MMNDLEHAMSLLGVAGDKDVCILNDFHTYSGINWKRLNRIVKRLVDCELLELVDMPNAKPMRRRSNGYTITKLGMGIYQKWRDVKAAYKWP